MTRRKKRSPRARSVPPPPSGAPPSGGEPPPSGGEPPSSRASEDRDASERMVRAEGVDAPSRPRARMRARRAGAGAGTGTGTGTGTGMARDEVPVLTAEVMAPAPPDRPSDPSVVARIRELEEKLDRMIETHARESSASLPQRASSLPPRPASASSLPLAPESAEALDGTGDETNGVGGAAVAPAPVPDFYLRRWGRLGPRSRVEEVDEFGHDPTFEHKVLPFFEFLYEKYFRVEVHGVDNVPADGRCMLIANHSGTLPFDGIMLRLAVRREHAQRRDVRWLAEDTIFHFPFLGAFSNRVGAVRACPENAERLLGHGALVAVFPEGLKGIGKLFKQRYQLQRFGRGGFVKLGLRTRTPVVPVAIVGGEETNPMLTRVEYLTRALGIPYLPVTPTFPLLGPAGLMPAPTKWKIFFGKPVDLASHGAEAADDEILVGRITEQVRGEIQGMLDRALAQRRSVWFG
jgi:1-acyl-sn-glycerol-3-phosphate acyltransferase